MTPDDKPAGHRTASTAAQPRRTPLAKAARSPVGIHQVTTTTKIRDILIVVVIPFAIPAAVLPIVNGSSSITVTNLAFGFIAVAVAGVARAVTSKTDAWLVYVLVAFSCVAFQTALAVGDDTSKVSDHLQHVVLTETQRPVPSISAMREAASAVTEAQPGVFHWTISALLGVMLVAISVELIRREQ
jgi:hypothetical protein